MGAVGGTEVVLRREIPARRAVSQGRPGGCCQQVLVDWGCPTFPEVVTVHVTGGLPPEPGTRAIIGKHTVYREFKERGARGFERFKRRLGDLAVRFRNPIVIIGGLPDY
jgi:hypothetical protein